jgi:hypothetical protein
VAETITELQQQAQVLKEHLAKAQNKMKMMVDKHKRHQEYQVGERVLLKLQPYAQSSLVNRPFPKLAFKYFGPYQVLERVGKAAYNLDLPEEARIHPVFHVSQLKPFSPNYKQIFSKLPAAVALDREDLLPEAVLQRRLIKKGSKAIPQALIIVERVADGSCYVGGLVCAPSEVSRMSCWRTSKLSRGGCHILKPSTRRRSTTLRFRYFVISIRRFCQVGPRARQTSNIVEVVCNWRTILYLKN